MDQPSILEPGTDRRQWLYLGLILLAGLGLRLFIAGRMAIINPDGVLYIHQARAIYHGLWAALTSCDFGSVHLSSYPFLVAAAYALIGHWEWAAIGVSVVFGTATVWPLYLLTRRFTSVRVALLTAWLYALTPFLAYWSAQVLRGPVYWFCLVLGLVMFIRARDRRAAGLPWAGPLTALAGVMMILAAWARLEGGVALAGSALFLVLWDRWRGLKDAAWLLAPAVLAAVIYLLAALGGEGHSAAGMMPRELGDILFRSLDKYNQLRSALLDLRAAPPPGIVPDFLTGAANLIWVIALAILVHTTMEAMFYPFFALAIVGLWRAGRGLVRDRGLAYLLTVMVCYLAILYVGLITTWFDIRRYWALVMLASAPLIGLGLAACLDWLETRRGLKASSALIGLVVLIAAVALPRNMVGHEQDKAVYRRAGEKISQTRPVGRPALVAAPGRDTALFWTIFYGNLDLDRPVCPRPDQRALIARLKAEPSEVGQILARQGYTHFLWLERHWPGSAELFAGADPPPGLTELGRWTHPDNGRIILFKVE